jgi:hypothetical protein
MESTPLINCLARKESHIHPCYQLQFHPGDGEQVATMRPLMDYRVSWYSHYYYFLSFPYIWILCRHVIVVNRRLFLLDSFLFSYLNKELFLLFLFINHKFFSQESANNKAVQSRGQNVSFWCNGGYKERSLLMLWNIWLLASPEMPIISMSAVEGTYMGR